VNHTYTSADTYRVRLRVIDRKGLRDETSYKIKINQDLVVTSPPIAEISGPANARVNETITFDGSRSQSLSPIERYEWDFGDGTTAQGQKVSHSYAKANLYRVRLTVYAQNGLVSNDNVQVRIDDQITAAGLQANIKAPGVGIVNQDIPFDGSQSTASNQIVSAAWSFGDGQNAQGLQVQHPYAARGTYEVSFTLTDDQGNTSTAKHTITIDDDPNALAPDIAVNPSTQVLQGDPLTFDAGNSKPDNLPDSAFGWQFGDGATATGKQVSHAYAAAGSYTVQLTEIGSNNQTATAQVNLDIQANNPPQAVISGLDQAETGQTVTFDAGQTQSSAAIVRYEWDFGDGTTATGPSVTHAFQPANSYNVTLQVTDQNNLHGTAQKSVQVKDPPVTPSQPPQAVISPPPAPIEAGRLVNFDGSGSQSGDQPIAGYTWDFGDRSPSASGPTVQHTYNQAGTYDVTLTVTDDQGTPNTTSVQVTVNPAPTTQPAVQPPQAVISAPTSETSANVGDTITFDGSGSVVQGQNISYAWDFGDGTQGNGPSVDHAYSGAATYNVTLVVTNESGTNKATVQLTIKAAAQSQPTPAPTPAPQPPQPVIDYEWDFGDGTTDNSGMGVGHSYSVAGKYTIQLTVTDQNGLTGIATWVIQIDPLAVPPLQPTPVPAEPTATPAPVQPADTPTPVPTDTPAAAPTDTPEPAPTDTPPSPPTDTPVPAPTDTPVPAPTDTPPPPPTDTPVPVPTDTPPPPPTDTPPPPPTDTPPPTPTETPPPPPPDNGDGGDGDQGG
jgi:PKD repeat protein